MRSPLAKKSTSHESVECLAVKLVGEEWRDGLGADGNEGIKKVKANIDLRLRVKDLLENGLQTRNQKSKELTSS